MHKDYRINLSTFVYRLFHEDYSPIISNKFGFSFSEL